jgi:hypothetical protein
MQTITVWLWIVKHKIIRHPGYRAISAEQQKWHDRQTPAMPFRASLFKFCRPMAGNTRPIPLDLVPY